MMKDFHLHLGIAGARLIGALCLAGVAEPAAFGGTVKALPTAEGFGANAVGGRGGRVIEVTTLADSGAGSLRTAMEASGPRIVVFRVSGTISEHLEKWKLLLWKTPRVVGMFFR